MTIEHYIRIKIYNVCLISRISSITVFLGFQGRRQRARPYSSIHSSFAIGGITLGNVDEVLAAGASAGVLPKAVFLRYLTRPGKYRRGRWGWAGARRRRS